MGGNLFYLNCIEDFGKYNHSNQNCLTIGDVIEDKTGLLKNVLIANFMIDLEWMISECPALVGVELLSVLSGEKGESFMQLQSALSTLKKLSHSNKDKWKDNVPRNPIQIDLHSPPLPIPFGSFHSKFLLLEYSAPPKLRVVVTTANFIYSDWWKKTQGIWVQDFLPKPNPTDLANPSRDPTEKSDFSGYLQQFLWKCGGPSAPFWSTLIDRYDFSSATCALVASVPGYHTVNMAKWGHLRLAHLLNEEAKITVSSAVYRNTPDSKKALKSDATRIDTVANLPLLETVQSPMRGKVTNRNSDGEDVDEKCHFISQNRKRLITSTSPQFPLTHCNCDESWHSIIPSSVKQLRFVLQFSSLGSLTAGWLFDEFMLSLTNGVPICHAPQLPPPCHAPQPPQPFASISASDASYPIAGGSETYPLPLSNTIVKSPRRSTGTKRQKVGESSTLSPNCRERMTADCIQILIPTVEQVRTSVEGWLSGVSIPISKKNIKPFMLPYLHKWGFPYVPRPKHFSTEADVYGEGIEAVNLLRQRALSVRSTAMPHIKQFFCYEEPQESTSAATPTPDAQHFLCGKKLRWSYTGSHNLSKAAWGEFQKRNTQFAIRSYELGVIFLPQTLGNKLSSPLWYAPYHWTLCRSAGGANPTEVGMASHVAASTAVSMPLADNTINNNNNTCNHPHMTCQPELWGVPFDDDRLSKGCQPFYTLASGTSNGVDSDEAKTAYYCIPLPVKLPPVKYTANDQPWNLTELRHTTDRFGHKFDSPGCISAQFYGRTAASFSD